MGRLDDQRAQRNNRRRMSLVIESKPDLPEFRKIFMDTFSDEPSFRFMLPNDRTRKSHVGWMYDKKLTLLKDSYYTLSATDPSKGFAWWIPPGKRPNHGVLEQMKAGYWQAPFRFGLRNFMRAVMFGNQESKILAHYLKNPHWILDVIAVAPTNQRSGLGGALMYPIFEKSKRDNIPCFVLTHNPRNVRFYEKYGFILKIQEPVMGPNTPVAYGLERPAQTEIRK